MPLISDTALLNFKSNPEKVFFRDLNNSLTGKQSLKLLNDYREKFLELDNRTVGIFYKNSIAWPLIYLAADTVCEKIFIFHSNLSESLVNELKERYSIDLIVSSDDRDLDLKTNTVKKTKDIESNNSIAKYREDILFTSGTTGNPKAVRIDEKSFMYVASTLVNHFDQDIDDLELLSMPFGHSFGLVRLRAALLSGCSVLITDGLKDFPRIYEFSKTNKITGLSFVPAALEVVKGLLRKKAQEFGMNIKYIELGSSSLAEDTRIWLADNFPKASIIHHYGMTEASRAFLRPLGVRDLKETPNNWVGHILEGCEYKIDSENYEDKKKGELLLRGKNLFSGYLGEDKSFESDDWFSTKDVCEEIEGKIYLIGRVDNQLNIGGEKIQAEEVEKLIGQLSSVTDVIAFQTPDKVLGKKIACLIQVSEDINHHEDVKLRVESQFKSLPSFMKPKLYISSQNLPKTENGKKLRDETSLNNFIDNLNDISEYTS